MKTTCRLIKFLLVILNLALIFQVNAQDLKQTVRGTVIDAESKTPIPGAHIIIAGTDPVIGAVSDMNGNFRLPDVPVGRVDIGVSSLGYEQQYFSNMMITSTKELVLRVELKESFVEMDEIVINGNDYAGEALNEMAQISARAFSVEETKRYAGSFNDPARMVSSFAGVMPAPEGDNFVAVRGNSPKGNQWRLEGIEIPNPNHFSSEGLTGGPINALNSFMLANSDFYTGAFPAEYGNAFSGIFDMKLRTGNNEKREYSFSAGVIGTDITLEGPFSKEKKSSYLLNYRYSTLALLEKTNIVNFDGVPKYQDLAFKLLLPAGSAGTFSVFGLGGLSELKHRLPSEENEDKIISTFNINSELGVVGVKHMIPLSQNTFIETNISTSENGHIYDDHQLNEQEELFLTGKENMRRYTVRGSSFVQSKINSRHLFSAGMEYTRHYYNYFTKFYDKQLDRMVTEQDEKGNAGLVQMYGNWKYRIFENLTLVSGIHYLNNRLNNSYSIEPRFSAKWHFTYNQSLQFGFGIHSMMESLPLYLVRQQLPDGTVYTPNRDLGFPKARHYILGYENRITSNLQFKIETYYQDLYSIPVENDPESSFSSLNQVGWYTTRELVNKGSGYNYGLELTLERYFTDNYYFLLTGSLYDSKYKALDNIERDTRWNGNYVGNFLFGKEFIFSRKPQRTKIFGINAKFSLIGARRYSPIDLEASREKGYTVVNEDEAFTLRGDDIFIGNISLTYRINRKKTSQEFKIDIQNFTNNNGMTDMYYDSATDKIEKIYQLPILPNIIYTLEF